MNLKKIAIIPCCIFLVACGPREADFTIKNKPALSLPDINGGEIDSSSAVTGQGPMTIDAAAASDQSSLVFSGAIQTVDSMIHGVRAPFYYIGARVNKVWKGAAGRTVYYISRGLPAADRKDMIFFLSAADSTDELVSTNKLRWEWTPNAPVVLSRDSARYLTRMDSAGVYLKSEGLQ